MFKKITDCLICHEERAHVQHVLSSMACLYCHNIRHKKNHHTLDFTLPNDILCN